MVGESEGGNLKRHISESTPYFLIGRARERKPSDAFSAGSSSRDFVNGLPHFVPTGTDRGGKKSRGANK